MLVSVAAHCVLLTESKGAFLAGAGALMFLFLFKRPVWFQIVVLMAAYVLGFAILRSLPRMDTLSKNDEGIQGRMIVWQQAKASMESTSTGVGLKLFQGYVPIRNAVLHRTWYMPIATHGSYVRHGADLGYVGLMLFAGIYYAGARILLIARTIPGSVSQRVQRTIYALMATMAFSCFVVDRAYHMDYFLLSGLLSAFHRRFLVLEKNDAEEDKVEKDVPVLPAAQGALQLPETQVSAALNVHEREVVADSTTAKESADDDADYTDHGALSLKWNRIGVIDVVIMYALMRTVVYFWELFSTDFIVF